jgi:hypothetical protein
VNTTCLLNYLAYDRPFSTVGWESDFGTKPVWKQVWFAVDSTNGGNPTVNSRCLRNYLVYDRSFPPLDGSQILEQIFSKIPRS